MSVISSIQSAAGNAATSARVAVTRGFREEVEGLAAAALGKKDETVEKLSAVEQRARQAANVAKLAVTTWLNTTGWGRILTNKYARTGALILITVLIIGLFYFSVAYIGLITMVQQE
jgi:F0F1-type ATP synthase assembly protein I